MRPKNIFKISENSNCRTNLLFDAKGLKLGHFGYFRYALHISGIPLSE